MTVERFFFTDNQNFIDGKYTKVERVKTHIQITDINNSAIMGGDVVDELTPHMGEKGISAYQAAAQSGDQDTAEQFAADLNSTQGRARQTQWPTPTQGFVPIEGEMWPDSSGKLRQVYAATFTGITNSHTGGFWITSAPVVQVQIIDFYVEKIEDGANFYAHAPGHGLVLNMSTHVSRPDGITGVDISSIPPDSQNSPYF